MHHLKFLLAIVVMAGMALTAPAFAVDISAGPIWNNDDAQQKCPRVCGGRHAWDGNWRTVEVGRNSVCSCRDYPSSGYRERYSRPAETTSCSIPPEGACRSCAVTCSAGREAHCMGGETRRDACVAQPSCSCR